MVDKGEFARQWPVILPRVKARWNKLTDGDLKGVQGNPELLISMIQEKYDEARQAIEIELKSLRRSPQTQKIYLSSVRRYLQWCADNQLPVQIDRRRAPSTRFHPLRSGSAASTSSSVNTAISRTYSCADLVFRCRSGCLDGTSTATSTSMAAPGTTWTAWRARENSGHG